MRPTVSLCICTMNRPGDLSACLDSVAALPAPPHQVLVSDDSRDVAMLEANRTVVARHPWATYLKGPSRGLSANRNHCLDRVIGDLVVFVDDDVLMHPDFLEKGPALFEELVGTVDGRDLILTGHEILPLGFGYPSRLTFLGFYDGAEPPREAPEAICINATLFPGKLFSRARFDEQIIFGAEERDFSFHALHLGYRILYHPELMNYHNPSPVNRDLYKASTVISRVYFGLKRYSMYQPSVARFLAFNIYVLANAVGNRIRALQFGEAVMAANAFLKAWKLFLKGPRPKAARPS